MLAGSERTSSACVRRRPHGGLGRCASLPSLLAFGLLWVGLCLDAARLRAEESSAADGALIEAVQRGNLGLVRARLAANADPNARDARLWTPLTYAAMSGYLEITDALLRSGAEVDARSADGSTPLMVAAVMGRTAVARRLLEAGADPTLRNSAGADARVKAEQYGHGQLAELLARSTSDWETAIAEAGAPVIENRSRAVSEPEPRLAGTAARSDLPDPREADRVEAEPGPARTRPELDPIDRDYVTTKDAIIRVGPVQKSARLGAVVGGTRMRVVGKVLGKDWYEVIFADGRGYVYDRLLRPASEQRDPPGEPEKKTPAAAEDLARGRWATPGNPNGCTRDYLEVRLADRAITLTVSAANELTVLAEDLPVLSVSGERLIAGSTELAWEFSVSEDELRYRVGSGKLVVYERCVATP